jgi:hypothetical protein
MPSLTIRIAALVLAFASSGALAGDLPGFTFIEACRTGETTAILRIVYDGGACETTAETEPTVTLDGALATVSVPTTATAEVCTMQIVPNTVEKPIAIAADTAELDVTVLATNGQPQARHSTPVLTDGDDCSAKGESF